MPSSLPSMIEPVLSIIDVVKPKSILDVGIGWGKYGLLAREYDPKLERLDGVEIYTPYIGPIQRAIYDHIYPCDIMALLDTEMYPYEMVLLIDLLEHLRREQGQLLLSRLSGHLVISTPDGFLPQGEVGGNPWERHRSGWWLEDFKGLVIHRHWQIRDQLLLHILIRREHDNAYQKADMGSQ